MSVLSDTEIIMSCLPEHRNALGDLIRPMIDPFEADQISQTEGGRRLLSYGVSSYGYDARLGWDFKVFTNIRSRIIDPKNFDEGVFEEVHASEQEGHEWVVIPPNSFALGYTIERFVIPRDIIVICMGKSTYARCGILVNITPLEPEWEGHLTVEISNTTPLPAVVYPGEGICQLLFLKASQVCRVSYKDKAGKYQGQPAGITLPKV